MFEASIPAEILFKLIATCFPDAPSDFKSVPTPAHVIQQVKKLFAPKLQSDDLEAILESPEVKFADIDFTISTLSKHVDSMSVFDLRELLNYKVFPCEHGDACLNKPPEVVSNNEYMDKCLECPFYHHEKDKRRLFLTFSENDDFAYKANYQRNGDNAEFELSSKNFFESLFHPIFYKLFPCKRKYCEGSYFCPFKHSDKEKMEWDDKFLKLTSKQRDIFLKEKSLMSSLSPPDSGSFTDDTIGRDITIDKGGF